MCNNLYCVLFKAFLQASNTKPFKGWRHRLKHNKKELHGGDKELK